VAAAVVGIESEVDLGRTPVVVVVVEAVLAGVGMPAAAALRNVAARGGSL